MRVRRGRGFNAQEVSNLRSWGYEPRPDEIQPAVGEGAISGRRSLLEGIPELAVLAHGTTRGRYEEILRRLSCRYEGMQNVPGGETRD